MRVLHINGNYIYSSVHRDMIRHMDEAGIDDFVFVPVRQGTNERKDLGANVCVKGCFGKWDRLWFANKQNKIFRSLTETIADKPKFDLVHAYTLFTDGNCAMRLSRQLGVPYVVAVRNTDVNLFFKHMIHLRKRGVEIMENASAIFFLSSSYRDEVLSRYVSDSLRASILEKSFLVPNGIDDFWFDNLYDRSETAELSRIAVEKKVDILYAGEINENKNLLLAAKAIQQLNEQGWQIRYTAVGRILDAAIFEKLKSYVFFHHVPPKPKEDLLFEYRKTDMFVMPSHTETFGLSYAEAMSQGLPVIYTRGQGFDGQFPEGTVGYSVDSHDADELADAIVRICEGYKELSKNCTNMVQAFHWGLIIRRYIRIYERIGVKPA